jgi:hypothetical protein
MPSFEERAASRCRLGFETTHIERDETPRRNARWSKIIVMTRSLSESSARGDLCVLLH